MKKLFVRAIALIIATILSFSSMESAHAELHWHWSYSRPGAEASGTLTTKDTPNSSDFYEIVGIEGKLNGIKITGLIPTGSLMPGNDPYTIDNVISSKNNQLTPDGFGFSLADGTYANPYFADFQTPAVYVEMFTDPEQPSKRSELPVKFSATIDDSK
jgi:hypothetical protein